MNFVYVAEISVTSLNLQVTLTWQFITAKDLFLSILATEILKLLKVTCEPQ